MDIVLITLLGILGLIGLVAIYQLVIGINTGCENPLRLFIGSLTNEQFRYLMSDIFSDPNLNITEHTVIGRRYHVWVGNGYYAFKINDVEEISFYQKYMFFKRLEEEKVKRLLGDEYVSRRSSSKAI